MNAPLMDHFEGVSTKTIDATYAMAYSFYENGKYQDAVQCFRLLALADGSNSKHWMGLGASNQLLQEYEEAAAAYAVAALLKPNDPYPAYYAAECFRDLKRETECLLALHSAAELAQHDEKYHELRWRIDFMRDAYINAITKE